MLDGIPSGFIALFDDGSSFKASLSCRLSWHILFLGNPKQ